MHVEVALEEDGVPSVELATHFTVATCGGDRGEGDGEQDCELEHSLSS